MSTLKAWIIEEIAKGSLLAAQSLHTRGYNKGKATAWI